MKTYLALQAWPDALPALQALRSAGIRLAFLSNFTAQMLDAAGAKWFGYPTFWVNRPGQPAEELGVRPDGSGSSMTDLANFVLR